MCVCIKDLLKEDKYNMGNSSSTAAVDELKNQVLGCAIFLLAPRFDDKLQFKKPEEITDDVKHALPYATSKDLLDVAKGYYGGGKVTAVDSVIERYITENVLDTPEHLTEFLGILVAKLRPSRRDVESVRTQTTVQRQQGGSVGAGTAKSTARPTRRAAPPAKVPAPIQEDDLSDDEVEALEAHEAARAAEQDDDIPADEFESEEQAERYFAWQHARKLGLQLQAQQASARAELHNARAVANRRVTQAQLESIGHKTEVSSQSSRRGPVASAQPQQLPQKQLQPQKEAPPQPQPQAQPQEEVRGPQEPEQQAPPVAEKKPSAYALARARAQARAAGTGAKIGGQIDKKLQQLDTTITKARGTATTAGTAAATAASSKKPEIDINDLIPSKKPRQRNQKAQLQEEQDTADGEYDQQSYNE